MSGYFASVPSLIDNDAVADGLAGKVARIAFDLGYTDDHDRPAVRVSVYVERQCIVTITVDYEETLLFVKQLTKEIRRNQ